VGLAKALSGPPREGLLPDLLKAIPIKKIDGAPDKAHPVKVVAKTGTLNFVSGLAGYATTSKGRQLSFAIFSGDLDRRDALGPDERDRPPGGRTWNTRAKQLQQALILRWDTLYDA
jgi:D-alanyl-D-alanine carboxypeptidase/D-alanyl-D-alanine-endopeptidase (penicillin-binding protein 4)